MAIGDDVRFTESMYTPDTLDLRITKELTTSNSSRYDVRESYARVAKRMGVDEETVRKRIRRQEKFGILQGWRAAIHPNLIGCVDVFVDIQVEGDKKKKEEVLSELKLLEGMIAITNFEGNGLYLLLYAEPGTALSRKIQLIRTICGTNEYNWATSLPPCNLKLSETDWRIVWSMRNDPRKNLSEIAKDSKVTTRTVNRRLNFLTEHHALFLVGLPNFKQTAGATGNFLIICSDKEKSSVSREVSSKFANIAFATPGAPYLMYNIYFHNISEAEAAHEWIGKLKGVEKVRLGIVKELIFIWDWLDDQMQKRLVDRA